MIECSVSWGELQIVERPEPLVLRSRGPLTPEVVAKLEEEMLQYDQAPINLTHIFSPGLYTRQLIIPADCYMVGHHQKTTQLNILAKGSGTVFLPDGSSVPVAAPAVWVGPPGRKVAHANEETIFLNVYPSEERDVEKLEEMFIEPSETFKQRQLRIAYKPDGDYDLFLQEFGVTDEVVAAISSCEDDVIPFPYGSYKVKVAKSVIHGRGLVATADIAVDEVICAARIGDMRTPACRYTNHARTPNARMVPVDNGDLVLIASAPIAGMRGGNDGDEVTVNYRDSVAVNLRSRGIP